MAELDLRQKAVDIFRAHLGEAEVGGKCPQWIADAYNECVDKYKRTVTDSLPRGSHFDTSWAWCAAACTAVQYLAGLGAYGCYEMSCTNMIAIAQVKGWWLEDESKYTAANAQIGDLVMYNWSDAGDYSHTDLTKSADHVGMVAEVHDDYMLVIEGNYSDSIKMRKLSYNGQYIRGFVKLDYESCQRSLQPNVQPAQKNEAVAILEDIKASIDKLIALEAGK